MYIVLCVMEWVHDNRDLVVVGSSVEILINPKKCPFIRQYLEDRPIEVAHNKVSICRGAYISDFINVMIFMDYGFIRKRYY